MMSKRLPLALVLSAVLFVTASFAASKKNRRNDRSRDWNDSPLVNGDLPRPGNSVYSGNSGWDSSGTLGNSGSSLILNSPGTFNNWNGGAGNWGTGTPGAIQSLRPGQAVIWNGGVGNWFSSPTNWTCLPQGSPCGPPNGPGWDVNIGDSGLDGTVLLNKPASVDQVTLGVAGIGTLNVSGNNTLTTTVTIVGNSSPGSGTLNIAGGGLVSDTTGYIGALSGAVGSVNVTGSGSQWNTLGKKQLFVGDYGYGTLTISGGGVVNSNGTHVGLQIGSSGNVTVSGPGSEWNDTGVVLIGLNGLKKGGEGSLTVSSGGTGSSAALLIGGAVTVTDPGSKWATTTGDLVVGEVVAPGTLTIANGAIVNNGGNSFIGSSGARPP
jgi:T5SS/PEP-CTERM-associated repeat protein